MLLALILFFSWLSKFLSRCNTLFPMLKISLPKLAVISSLYRSLPDLEVVGETSLMATMRWNFKTNMDKMMSSSDKGQITLVSVLLAYVQWPLLTLSLLCVAPLYSCYWSALCCDLYSLYFFTGIKISVGVQLEIVHIYKTSTKF